MKLQINKKWLFVGLGVAVLIVAVVVFLVRSETGTLTIAAPSSVEISTGEIDGVVLQESVMRGKGDQSFTVPVGAYLVSGVSDEAAYKAIVNVTESEETSVAFEPYDRQTLEAQDSIKAKFFTKANDNYRYLDNEDGVLYTYYGPDIIPERFNFSARDISEISWLSSSTGLAVANGQIYSVSSNSFELLPYPGGQQPELDIQPIVTGYSVSDDGVIYVVIDGNLYSYSSATTQPQLIDELNSFATYPFSSPNGNLVLATDTTLSGHREEAVINTVLSEDGEVLVDTFSDRGVFSISWSPDNQNFAFSDDIGVWAYDLSAQTSELLIKGSDFSSGSIVWVDSSTLLHYDQGQLWEYDVASGVGIARYIFNQPELLSGFTAPGSMTLLDDELVLSIDTVSATSPSKLFFIPTQD